MNRKPSDVLPSPKLGQGDSAADAIFLQVGRALDTWESVEEVLADIFAVLTGEGPSDLASPARRAYGSIATFRGRKEMILSAGEAYFLNRAEKGPYAELKSLLNKANDFSARRNEIAHGVVRQFNVASEVSTLPNGFNTPTDETWYIIPPKYNSNKTRAKPQAIPVDMKKGQTFLDAVRDHMIESMESGPGKYKYNSTQIEYYRDQFLLLYKEAAAARDKLAKRAGP